MIHRFIYMNTNVYISDNVRIRFSFICGYSYISSQWILGVHRFCCRIGFSFRCIFIFHHLNIWKYREPFYLCIFVDIQNLLTIDRFRQVINDINKDCVVAYYLPIFFFSYHEYIKI